ncbi:hypothetical protein [Virgibacillus sp. MSP4-1]|uniref:hypothetical protein n=1 Tax=Virgibacillus sp. MSP4-1 TaxID=2700081 RepID=UPI00351BAAE9
MKRFFISGMVIVIIELINHKVGQKRNWWAFYDRKKSFMTNELPFSIGPYMPIAMWILRFSFGNFKKFLLTNAVSDGTFAYIGMKLLQKIKIIRLNRLNQLQFFVYLYYKAFILYGVQYLVENRRGKSKADT